MYTVRLEYFHNTTDFVSILQSSINLFVVQQQSGMAESLYYIEGKRSLSHVASC